MIESIIHTERQILERMGVFGQGNQFRFAADEIPGHTYSQGIVAVAGACPPAQTLLGPMAE